VFALALALAPVASAATITVTGTSDETAIDGAISLREALDSINLGADFNADVTHTGAYGVNDTIMLPPSLAHYEVTGGELVLEKSAAIVGAGAAITIIDAGGASRVLRITKGAARIAGVTITGGHATTGAGGGAVAAAGAEVSELTISSSAFIDNTATASGGTTNGGGAVWAGEGAVVESSTFTNNSFIQTSGVSNDGGGALFNSNTGLTVTNSSFVNNSATLASEHNNGGGAIYQDGSAETLTNDTFAGNSARITAGGGSSESNGGGANYQDGSILTIGGTTFSGNSVSVTNPSKNSGGGAIFHDGSTFSLTNSTFAGNSAAPLPSAEGVGGGAILSNSAAQLSFTNDTIDGNQTSAAGGNVLGTNAAGTITSKNTIIAAGGAASGSNCAGPGKLASAGHNIEDGAPSRCGLGAIGDRIGVSPLLGALQNNGGPTQTEELLPGSPAIDAGDNTGCPASDQRGIVRPHGSACDVGALEVSPPLATTGAASAIGGSSATLNASATNPNPLIGGTVFVQYGPTVRYGSQTAVRSLAIGVTTTAFSVTVAGLPTGAPIHYRAVAQSADGIGFGADRTFTTAAPSLAAPSLSSLSIKPSDFRARRNRGPSIARTRKATGAFITYNDSQAAVTTFTVERPHKGFRAGHRCVAGPAHHRRGRSLRCTLYRAVGSFSHTDMPGPNRFHFSGRIEQRPLPVGRYRLHALARNSGGQLSAARFVGFRIVR
jgi:hypothetical protein